MTEQKRLETKESTKYSVLEITTTTFIPFNKDEMCVVAGMHGPEDDF